MNKRKTLRAMAVSPIMRASEIKALHKYEAVIEKGAHSFVAVGKALLAIKMGLLFRDQYENFDDYLTRRWGIKRRWANTLIAQATPTDGASNRHDTANGTPRTTVISAALGRRRCCQSLQHLAAIHAPPWRALGRGLGRRTLRARMPNLNMRTRKRGCQ